MQVRQELSCFCTFDVHLEEVRNPLIWQSKHEGKFPRVAYLARAILDIPSSQIERERVFSIVSILTRLCHC
jgi:predicted Rdx family selenoprotein